MYIWRTICKAATVRQTVLMLILFAALVSGMYSLHQKVVKKHNKSVQKISSNEEKNTEKCKILFHFKKKKKKIRQKKKIWSPPHVHATTIFRNYEAIVTGKQECLATEWRRPPWKRV
jgi:hypothetical protein